MQIKKAIIENFKSITNEEIDFTHDCKIFVGLSESGKTNLLLALSALDTTFTLKEDQIYVLGDNADESVDSRYFGPVTKSDVEGLVILRIYPFNEIQMLKGWLI